MGSAPARLLLGTPEPVAETLRLRAGPLQVRLRGTRLLMMEVDGHEVWHGAAFLYRDEGWGTPEPVVDHTDLELHEDCFTLRIAGHILASQRIDLSINIQGYADGSVTYEACAVVNADMLANRIGLCVMHPSSAGGQQVEVTHVDGRTSASRFPVRVAPWPPFTLVRGLRHEYAEGAWASCWLEGDSFELEDQRNNADASFKTYSRSNLMPRPLSLSGGQTIRQGLRLKIENLPASPSAPRVPALVPVGALKPMPAIGVGMAVGDVQAGVPSALADAVGELAPARLHLGLRSPQETVHWPGVAALLEASGAHLRLDIEGLEGASAQGALSSLAARMARSGVVPVEVAVFPGTPAVLAAARCAWPAAAIGSGTPYFFAQLNRIEGLGPVDFLTFTTCSIVHGADDDAVMHGLQSLPGLMDTLGADHPQVPVHTGPSAIAAPRSPLGVQAVGDGVHRVALAQHDPRTGALFGAAWALAHIAQMARAGAQSVAVLHLLGAQGILAADPGAGLRRRPVFFVLQALCNATHLRSVDTGIPDQVAAVWVQKSGQESLLLANLTDASLNLPLPVWVKGPAHSLDPLAVEEESGPPWRAIPLIDERQVHLTPWAVLRLEGMAPWGDVLVHKETPGAT